MKCCIAMVNGVPVVTEEPYAMNIITWIEVDTEELRVHPLDELKDILVAIVTAERCGWREK